MFGTLASVDGMTAKQPLATPRRCRQGARIR